MTLLSTILILINIIIISYLIYLLSTFHETILKQKEGENRPQNITVIFDKSPSTDTVPEQKKKAPIKKTKPVQKKKVAVDKVKKEKKDD